jgi:hypothetical protein
MTHEVFRVSNSLIERPPRPEPPIGELVWSDYFAWVVIVDYHDDGDWSFAVVGLPRLGVMQARAPLSEMPGRAAARSLGLSA